MDTCTCLKMLKVEVEVVTNPLIWILDSFNLMFKCLSKYFTGFNFNLINLSLMKFICTTLYRVLNFYTPNPSVYYK